MGLKDAATKNQFAEHDPRMLHMLAFHSERTVTG